MNARKDGQETAGMMGDDAPCREGTCTTRPPMPCDPSLHEPPKPGHAAPTAPRTAPGAAIYSSLVLRVYDMWVLGFSNRWAWRCPTADILLPFYRRNVGMRHLDVGVGTGFYLAHTPLSPAHEVSLLDLNPNSIDAAARRIGSPVAGRYLADVMRPPAALAGLRFDSISLFYLLHCLPGSFDTKEVVFANLKAHLATEGVLYGATILGEEARHNRLGRALMKVYNRKGIFGNRADTLDGLRAALGAHFDEVSISVHGKVALFSARFPTGA